MFSVIVTTYGRSAFIDAALESLFAQTIQDFEVVLVVDGGEVPTGLTDDSRLRVVRRETNGGFPAALNTGLEQIRGRYVTVLDDDDLYARDRLELGLRGMERAPVAICWRGNPSTGKVGANRMLEGFVHDTILDRPIPTLGQTTVRREAMLTFDERCRNSADVEWWIRMSAHHPVTTEPQVGLWLRRHDSRNSLNFESRYRSRTLIYQKHRDYFESHPNAEGRYLERTAYFARMTGHPKSARNYLWRALRVRPRFGTLLRFMRAWLPVRQRESGTTQLSR